MPLAPETSRGELHAALWLRVPGELPAPGDHAAHGQMLPNSHGCPEEKTGGQRVLGLVVDSTDGFLINPSFNIFF